jgi:uncharacterized protein YjcR
MAERGKPLPFTNRAEIKQLTATMPIKVVARALGMSPNTIRKYKSSLNPSAQRQGKI